ncbi:hypothetical protein Ahy_A05g025479 isoform C [Arachis hypogaea]|uniref:EF-hand domain-containing protein n=1 Tax=Arachis hypogaea TaxID=3818 RepID=A0A445D8T4_ARAHY|nr:hypothetical protein Ahy_A05g025479 isoform C [Arachis hypogaea]
MTRVLRSSLAVVVFFTALLASCSARIRFYSDPLMSCASSRIVYSALLCHVRSSARVILKHSLCSTVVSFTSFSQVSQHRLCNSLAVSFKLYDLDSTGFIECQEIVDIGKTLPLFMELQILGDRT